MGRVFRVWHGEWKKNERNHWHFVPTPADYGFTVYMDSPETYELLDSLVRENYVLTDSSPVVITYGMPDWMLFPSGQAPPITVSTTADLVNLIERRPPTSDVNLMVTIGAKSVAEYQFLRRTDFSVGSTHYVVDGSQDDMAQAEYERLVFGERIPTSETVMTEIFGEQEMLIFHRIALEMDLADRELRRQQETIRQQQSEIINLDDDDDMVDATPLPAVPPNNVGEIFGGGQPLALTNMTATQAPPVMWDVGIDLFNYPEYYNNQRDEGFDGGDVDFWRGLIDEGSFSSGGCVPENIETDSVESVLPPLHPFIALSIESDAEKTDGLDNVLGDADSSTETTGGPLGQKSIIMEAAAFEQADTGREQLNRLTPPPPDNIPPSSTQVLVPEAENLTCSLGHPVESVALELSLACGISAGDAVKAEPIKPDNSTSEESETEGEGGDYSNQVEVGMIFRNRDAFKQHMAMYAIFKKFKFRCGKSDPSMMVLKCSSPSCPWRVYAVKLKDSQLFEIRSLTSTHNCSIDVRGGYERQATSSVIGELMKTKFGGIGGGPKPREIRKMMRGDHDVSISYWKAWKSRDMAVDNQQGTCTASYLQLPAYLHNLVIANPGSIADLHTQNTADGEIRFKYMFLAFGASIMGYESMRKVIVVDGTHLKGKYGGCMLTASAQDGNHQIFPLAFAIVDSENDVSWEWFFKHLSSFVLNDPSLVIVSDRHPSINKAITKVFPSAGHCACVVHLKRNIRTNFKGRQLGYLVAKAARAFTQQDFKVMFNEIKESDPSCADYLVRMGFSHWARSQFSGKRYNIMTSNLAESWNAVLREAREYPIIPLIEFIRGKLMMWFATRRQASINNENLLTPRILEIVTSNFEKTGGYEVVEIGGNEFEVRNKSGVSFHVNLGALTCSCFEFQMLCIPCSHAIAAALKAKISVETLVTEEYNVSLLRNAYEGTIVPISQGDEMDMPSEITSMHLSPPATRRPPGRPKKLRYFSKGESRTKMVRRRISCSRCRGIGHNKTTCKNPI